MELLHRLRRANQRLRSCGGRFGRLPATALAAALLPAFLGPGCGTPAEGGTASPPDSLLRARLGLREDARVHRVLLSGVGDVEEAAPDSLGVLPGDFVEFYVADGNVHTVVFPPDSLGGAEAAFLREEAQDASPPLLERGARFVVTFEGAPLGRYPYLAAAHGDTASGTIVVVDAIGAKPGGER